MPTYNGSRYVGHALESVRDQQAEGIEVLIVDDGSSDATLDIVRTFEGSLSIRRIPHDPGGNWVRASNAGLREARGRHACFLHQDDLWLPGRLSILRRAISRDAPAGSVLRAPRALRGAGRRAPRVVAMSARGWPRGARGVRGAPAGAKLHRDSRHPSSTPTWRCASGGLDESLWYTGRLASSGSGWAPRARSGSWASRLPLSAVHPESQNGGASYPLRGVAAAADDGPRAAPGELVRPGPKEAIGPARGRALGEGQRRARRPVPRTGRAPAVAARGGAPGPRPRGLAPLSPRFADRRSRPAPGASQAAETPSRGDRAGGQMTREREVLHRPSSPAIFQNTALMLLTSIRMLAGRRHSIERPCRPGLR